LWFRVTILKKFTGMSDFTFRHFRNIVVSANRELQLQKEKDFLLSDFLLHFCIDKDLHEL